MPFLMMRMGLGGESWHMLVLTLLVSNFFDFIISFVSMMLLYKFMYGSFRLRFCLDV